MIFSDVLIAITILQGYWRRFWNYIDFFVVVTTTPLSKWRILLYISVHMGEQWKHICPWYINLGTQFLCQGNLSWITTRASFAGHQIYCGSAHQWPSKMLPWHWKCQFCVEDIKVVSLKNTSLITLYFAYIHMHTNCCKRIHQFHDC